MNQQEFEEQVNSLKERSSLRYVDPIHLGCGNIYFYEYTHKCSRMEKDGYEILGVEYRYTYSSWAGGYNIGEKKIEDRFFALGDSLGFSFPAEGDRIDGILFCPFCGLDLTKDAKRKEL